MASATAATSIKDCEFDFWSDLERAELYAKHRPEYQKHVIPWLLDFYKQKHPRSAGSKIPLAIDVACGSGQLTGELARACQRVIGIDISAQQLTTARKYNGHPNIEYKKGSALHLSRACPKKKADIIVVGLALQFFPNEAFLAEVKKCLKPGGVFAAFGYLPTDFEIDEKVDLSSAFEELVCSHITKNEQFVAPLMTIKAHYNNIDWPMDTVSREITTRYPATRESVKALFTSNPMLFGNEMASIEEFLQRFPKNKPFTMVLDVFGIMFQIE